MAKRKPQTAVKKPSRAELDQQAMETEILAFWQAIGENDLPNFKYPWVFNLAAAENAGKYLLAGERYLYRGGVNRFLIARAAEMCEDAERAPLILNRSDMTRLFGVDEFAKTPVVEARIRSATSLFNRPMKKRVGTEYVDSSGQVHKGVTEAEAEARGLEGRPIERFVFKTYPAWSVADVYPVMSDELKAQVDELVELRRGKGYAFNPEDDIEQYIDARIDEIVTHQALDVTESGGNQAFYRPREDVIRLPGKAQFKNPVVRFSTTMHELAHSTMHLHERPMSRGKFSEEYAIEEVVAETTAVMLVKDLERRLADALPSRPDIQAMFDDYYANSMTYQREWGDHVNFLEHVAMLQQEASTQKGLAVKVLTWVTQAAEALLHETYTTEQRLKARDEAMAKFDGRPIERPEPVAVNG